MSVISKELRNKLFKDFIENPCMIITGEDKNGSIHIIRKKYRGLIYPHIKFQEQHPSSL